MNYNKKCLKCGYEWGSIKGDPKQCPRCKRYDWNKDSQWIGY